MKKRLLFLLSAVLMLWSIGVQAQKKVHMLGDSTMAWYDENITGERGWGMYFGTFLTNGWTSVNYAKGGRDSRGGYNELWQNAKGNVQPGDYVIIQFAHNDGKYNGIDNLELQAYYNGAGDTNNANAVKSDGRGTTPTTTYKECLTQIVNAVKEKGAIPILVSAVCRCNFDSNNKITRSARHDLGGKYDAIVDGQLKTNQSVPETDHSMDYSYQMQQLATELGVVFIDMTTATKNLYESYGNYSKCYSALFDKVDIIDNTHYNLTGALSAARLCAQLMKEAGILSENIEIPSDLAFTPSQADLGDVYVGQSGTKELTISGLGLDPATGTIDISATEGILLSFDKQNWQTSLQVSYENGTLIKTLYAKVAATAVGTFNGTITATQGSKTVEVPVSLNAIELGGGEPFSVVWPLTSDDKAVVTGNVTGSDAKIEGMVKYGNNATNGLMVSTSDGGAWVKAEDDSPNQYVQFTLTAPDGQKLDINRIAMKVGGRGGNGMHCHIYYSTDGFVTRNAIQVPGTMASGVFNDVEATPVVHLEEGDQLQVRIYPWYTSDATGKWLIVKDVEVSGQSKDAAGVTITGTITYVLDQGGLAQGNDAVMDPTELSAGFAGKTWTAGSALTVEGTLNYVGAEEESIITQTRIYNGTGASFPSTAGSDNTLTLTLTPEDGFSFVPTKLLFQASRYGTDSGNISASVDAGDTHMDLVSNEGVNRSDKVLTISSFEEEISGVTATADKPLKVNFSFLGLGKTKTMGLSNVIIEGTLVGAATQTVKYVLTTSVEPTEAGSISREPDLEQYKEGSQVTLKATKNFGYKFVEWQNADGSTLSTNATTTITMDAAKSVKAVFEAVPVYTVTTKCTNDSEQELGTITLTPNDHEGKYEAGTKITAVANESKILKFLQWTDQNENAGTTATRELTVNSDMTLVANYEVQDFIAVFDGSVNKGYAPSSTYPFPADITCDNQRNATASIVKAADGTLLKGINGTPVVRNRPESDKAIIAGIGGVFTNGFKSSDIAFQYQFSTVGFTSTTFEADMVAKNMANKNWKALISTDGTTFTDLGEPWELTTGTAKALKFDVPENQSKVIIRITGTGTEMLSDKYVFDKTSDEGLVYCSNSETMVGNVFVLGEVESVADTDAPQVTATVPADQATGISANGKITISFDERIESAGSNQSATLAATDNSSTLSLTPSWSNRSVSFNYKGLTYGATYTFTMPANYVQDRSGNKMTTPLTFTFSVMERPTVTVQLYDAVVSSVEELSAAINEANNRADKTTRYRIFVKKGTYKMPTGATKHYVHQNNDKTVIYWEGDLPDPITYIKAANISLIGEDRDATVITQDISNDDDMLFTGQFGKVHKYEEINNSAVLQLESTATGMYFQDITIKSGINDALGRNLAVHDKSSHTIYKNTLLYGYQDTWTSNNQQGLFYFEDGQVRGRTDYLCGKGDAYFNRLELLQLKDGYAAVPSTPANVGWVFQECTISGEGSDVNGSYSLGRPWGKGTPVAVFIDTKMEVVPSAIGWSEMNDGWPKRFAEWNSMNGNGGVVDLSGRKTTFASTHENNPVLTQEEADAYSDMTNMFGDWIPTMATEQAPVPTGVTVNGSTLSWTGSDYALLYAICKDGDVIDFVTTTSYEVTEDGSYTVRAANEMGGLSEPSEAASVTTGIATHRSTLDAQPTAIYTADGRRLSSLQRGVNIVRMADGRTIKIVK